MYLLFKLDEAGFSLWGRFLFLHFLNSRDLLIASPRHFSANLRFGFTHARAGRRVWRVVEAGQGAWLLLLFGNFFHSTLAWF